MENNTILSIRDLTVHYITREMGTCRAVNDFSLDIFRGETVGLVGETGAGKTTVALSIMMRSGPGSGTIYASQGDYFQATRGGGNGDYNVAVLAPASVQEAVDLLQDAFDLTDRYRVPVLLLGDAIIGQMMEPAEILPRRRTPYDISAWATRGWDDKSRARVAMASRNPTLQDNIDRIEGMGLLFVAGGWGYAACIAGISFCYGASSSLTSIMNVESFGSKYLSSNYGLMAVAVLISGIVSPSLSTLLSPDGIPSTATLAVPMAVSARVMFRLGPNSPVA